MKDPRHEESVTGASNHRTSNPNYVGLPTGTKTLYADLTAAGHPIWTATKRFPEGWNNPELFSVEDNDDQLADHIYGDGSHVAAVLAPGAYAVIDIDRHGDDPAEWGDVDAVTASLEAAGVTIAAQVATGGDGYHLYVPSSLRHEKDRTGRGVFPDFPGAEFKTKGIVFLPGSHREKHDYTPYTLEWSRLGEILEDIDTFQPSQKALASWLDEHLRTTAR